MTATEERCESSRGKRSEEAVGKGRKKQQKKSTGSSYERYADKMAVCEIASLR